MPRKKRPFHVTIEILNPEIWGLKRTDKQQHYFKFRTDFFSSAQVMTLSNDAILLFLIILSEYSRRGCEPISYCLDYACGLLSVPLGVGKGLLKELESNDIIHLKRKIRPNIHNITEHNRTKHKTPKPLPQNRGTVYDFETPYKTFYLNKGTGKSAGMEQLKKTILTDKDYSDFLMAIENYHDLCISRGTEKKYIKGFRAFSKEWRDYIEADDEILSIRKAREFWSQAEANQNSDVDIFKGLDL